MFNFFKKKEPALNYSSAKVDFHSHLIPAIDDGAQNLEESIALVQKLIDLGYQKIITTPHIMSDFFRNTPEIINSGLTILKEELNQRKITIEIEAAAEYYLDENFEDKLESGSILTIADEYILFELSFLTVPPILFETIDKIKANGYKPILAHPERYSYFYRSIENYEKIKDAGCFLQLNTIALAGYYGKPAQRVAEELVDNNLIDFIGSDMHHLKHAAALKQVLNNARVKRLLTDYPLLNNTLLKK